MIGLKQRLNRLSTALKIILAILIVCFILLIITFIPTLARFIYGDGSIETSSWNGVSATSFRSGTGTENDPFIITNAAELSYLSDQLQEKTFIDEYIEISNNIIINKGILKYNDENLEYIIDDVIYYIKPYTNEYYEDVNLEVQAGTLNIFPYLDSFEGNLNGNNKTIYGLYITSDEDEIVSLFTNLKGNISNLYINNELVYGGSLTSGLASNSSNNILENIYVDGYVIGNLNSTDTVQKPFNRDSINIYSYETTNYFDLSNLIPFVGDEIISSKITGNYSLLDPDAEIYINEVKITGGSFEVNLGTIPLNSVSIRTSTTLSSNEISFDNLHYTVTYNNGVSSGIISDGTNVELKNVVNKAEVYSNFISSGIISTPNKETTITNTYNNGNINSNFISGGLIGNISNNEDIVSITNSYNSGNITSIYSGGLIGIIDNAVQVDLLNLFDMSDNYVINKVVQSTVTVNNSYFISDELSINTGYVTGSFIKTTINNLQNREFLINNLNYLEYIDEEDLILNPDNLWSFNENSNPLLYFDDELNKLINVYVAANIYKKYNVDLNNIYLKQNIIFTVDGINNFIPVEKVEFYIGDSTLITKENLELEESWTDFDEVSQINEDGKYIIYFKVTDYKGRISYINTDILILDKTHPSITISMKEKTWNKLDNSPGKSFISNINNLQVNATDNMSGIKSIDYYISETLILEENLSNTDWISYEENITVNSEGNNIIYIKAEDNSGNITYINTDYIVYNGFKIESLSLGRDNKYDYENNNFDITNKSSITIKTSFTYEEFEEINNYNHFIKSNVLFPEGTKLTLINHGDNSVYAYSILNDLDNFGYNESCSVEDLDCEKEATYPFTIFNEEGTVNNEPFEENIIIKNNNIIEDYTLIIDFKNSIIDQDYENIKIYFEMKNNNDIISTIETTYKQFNIYYDEVDAILNLTSDYSESAILLNTESNTQITLNSSINYYTLNDKVIYDTTYEDYKTGLLISFVDEEDNLINKKHLKDTIFKINNVIYTPDNDNLIRAQILNGEDIVLNIITNEKETNLSEGTYHFKIKNFISSNGLYANKYGEDEIIIPVIVTNSGYEVSNYEFKVSCDSYVIEKELNISPLIFKISKTGYLNNPNIRISLYEKDVLTAYNQDYSLIDLNTYVESNLELIENNVYYLTKSANEDVTVTFNLKGNLLNYNGYKFIIDLYEDDKKIDSIKHNFIVR